MTWLSPFIDCDMGKAVEKVVSCDNCHGEIARSKNGRTLVIPGGNAFITEHGRTIVLCRSCLHALST